MRALLFILMGMFQIIFICRAEEVSSEPISRRTYKGEYPLPGYKAESQYTYLLKSDGSYVYDGDFILTGLHNLSSYIDIVDCSYLAGALDCADKDTRDEEKKYSRLWGDEYAAHRRKIKIEGKFINGMREGEWLFTSQRYHVVQKKYVDSDTMRISYKHGVIHGKCYYSFHSMSGRLRKKVVSDYDQNRVRRSEIQYYSNTNERIMVATYRFQGNESEPSGVWKQETDEGVIYRDFDKREKYLLNKFTGQKSDSFNSHFDVYDPPFKLGLFDFLLGEKGHIYQKINQFTEEEYQKLTQ